MKYAAEIAAVAQGQLIEYRRGDGPWYRLADQSSTIRWLLSESPDLYEVRIVKPPKPDVVRFVCAVPYSGQTTLEGAIKTRSKYLPDASIEKRTFEGETGKLKKVEIVE